MMSPVTRTISIYSSGLSAPLCGWILSTWDNHYTSDLRAPSLQEWAISHHTQWALEPCRQAGHAQSSQIVQSSLGITTYQWAQWQTCLGCTTSGPLPIWASCQDRLTLAWHSPLEPKTMAQPLGWPLTH